jgi:integrase
LRDRRHRVERTGYFRPAPRTLQAFGDEWLDGRERELRASSIRAYRVALAPVFDALGHVRLAELSPRHLTEYGQKALDHYSGTSVNYQLSLVSKLLRSARAQALVARNVMEDVERPRKCERELQVPSGADLGAVGREFQDERARLIFLTVTRTGLRRHELQNLRWREVDLIGNVLRVKASKTEAGRRSIALPTMLAGAFWQFRRQTPFQGDDEYVFAHPRTGGPFNADWWAQEYRDACGRAGVEPVERPLHDLRHASITHYSATGASEAKIMAFAGHSSPAMTKHYQHLAGLVFHEEAAALEARLAGQKVVPALYPSEGPLASLASSEAPSQAA